ncbi:MAG: trimethylamine methyltransferase family protein [Deltaproteobacteria bacterium]|nr:trimethylamine methyltransferase family protein [Deltaproteobacteria bacterium]
MDSKLCDAQAGYESLLTALPPALAGANLIYGTGMVDSGMTLDYGKMIIDDEINQAIKYVVKGFEVNDETLSVGLIEEIGHTGNHLSHPSTFHHCGDLMVPQLMNRENYDQWMAKGGTDVYERALDKARDVVENHQPSPIGRQAQKEIDEIIRETEKELKVTL